jgi:histidine ammonia-lyase
MVELGGTIAAIELTVGAQALELRGHRPGTGTGRALTAVREHVPFLTIDGRVPDVAELAGAVRSGAITAAVFGPAGPAVASTAPRGIGDGDRA